MIEGPARLASMLSSSLNHKRLNMEEEEEEKRRAVALSRRGNLVCALWMAQRIEREREKEREKSLDDVFDGVTRLRLLIPSL